MTPLVLSVAERQYEVGETYRLEPCAKNAPPASHGHYFAADPTRAWRNLPEHLAERFADRPSI